MSKTFFFIAIFLLNTIVHAQWIQKGMDIDGEAANDQSGRSVSMSSNGNTIAIGAYSNDGAGADAGHVRIFEWNGTTWIQKGIDIDADAADDRSGYSVSISSDGNDLAIGAINNDGSASNAGHVRIYEWDGTAWVQKGVDIDGEAADDQSGFSVSMSSNGNILAIGAWNNDGAGINSGHTRIYEWIGTWAQKGADIDGEAPVDLSGYSVSLSSDGNTVAIGANNNDGSGSNSGHARVYEWSGTTWTQKGMDINGEATGDNSGGSVSMSSNGNTIAIGAHKNDETGIDAGHVRIYEWSGTAWTQKGADINGEAADDRSGTVSLNSDGNTVAIGAFYNDGAATDAGHVRIYEWNGSVWVQKELDIDGEAADDLSGYSVSMSSDGNSLAIGAYLNDGAGIDAGHVRIYEINTVGVLENSFRNDPLLYPNPTDGNFTIDLRNIYTSVNITMTDINGKLIQSQQYKKRQLFNLTIGGPAGIYLLTIESEDKKALIRLIKD
ncbi:MAG: hypothetical protein ACI9J3_002664 [Parvicellaceae bacterium]|jgi:hypothetical protein